MNKHTADRAQELRSAFDQEFARLPNAERKGERDLLAITLAGDAYALELGDIAGIYTDKKITRIPSQSAGLLGIAGFRGAILPVYDLAVLIGLGAIEQPKWLAIVAKAGIAVAFERFDRHLRALQEDIAVSESTEGARKHVRHVLRTPERMYSVINMSSAVQTVTTPETQLGSE